MPEISVENLYTYLKKTKVFKKIVSSPVFYDEPRFHSFTSYLDSPRLSADTHTASGLSFLSEEKALFKCLVETVERFCLLHLSPQVKTKKSTWNNITDPAFSLSSIRPDFNTLMCTWIEGENFYNKKKAWIPLQMVYLFNFPQKLYLGPLTSNGTAAGFSAQQTILNSLYELIERDAFMTSYLLKAPIGRINPIQLSKQSVLINNALRQCHVNNLELHVFDIANDLCVPSYLSLVIDRTGVGPAVSAGAKSHLNQQLALEGAVEESFLTRPWIRMNMMNQSVIKKDTMVRNLTERGLYWARIQNLKELNYLTKRPFKKSFSLTSAFKLSEEAQMTYLRQIFKKNKFNVFHVDISHANFSKIPIYVYKTIVPQLQPFYLNEKDKIINVERLKNVAEFFHISANNINKTPHFFL